MLLVFILLLKHGFSFILNESRYKESLKFSKSELNFFVDGACSGNPGPGGWGGVLFLPNNQVLEFGGAEEFTTNNRMELIAAIQAFSLPLLNQFFEFPSVVFTDSTYVIHGITQWRFSWEKKGWKTASGKNVANMDLWKRLLLKVESRIIRWEFVRGHSGIVGNERADKIAVSFSKKIVPDLYHGCADTYPPMMLSCIK